MTPRRYQDFRDELTGLLAGILRLQALDGHARKRIARIRARVMENQFRIVLAGEFQSGKSTTFNTLCDGRDLSPTGFGIKTSGCLLTARNLSDPDAPEKARIFWRNPAELIAGFSDLLLPRLQEAGPDRFGRIGATELAGHIRLDHPPDRLLLSAAIRSEWALWRKNRQGYDPEGRGYLDMLRAAALILHFHEHPELAAWREKTDWAIPDACRLAAFPADWEVRWADGDPDRFQVAEIGFIFIREIRLHLHSPQLGRLGCVLVDCPGLLASRWDTDTARRAMFDADAVLYLFDGSKTLKMSDLKALSFIRNNGMAGRLLFGCNLRGHSIADGRRIREASLIALRNNGFDVPDEACALYHALLGFQATRTARLIASGAAAADLEAGLSLLRRQILILSPGENAAPPEADLTAASFDLSGFKALSEMVEAQVVARKAHAVLVDNGARIARQCLDETAGALKLREDLALQQEAGFRWNVALVETGIRKFKGDCMIAIDRMADEGPDADLADDIWQRLTASRETLVDRCTRRIHEDIIGGFSPALLSRKTFNARLAALIREEIDAVFTDTIHAWVAEIRAGHHPIYNARVGRRVREISRDLNRIWEASGLSETDLLAGIEVPELSGNLTPDTDRIFQDMESDAAFEGVRYSAILAAGGITGIFTAFSGILVAVYLLITRLFWVKIATVAALIANILIMLLTRGMLEKSMKKDIQGKLDPSFTVFFEDIRGDIQREFRQFVRDIRMFYRHYFLAAIDKPRQVFDDRRQRAQADFTRDRESRIADAATARRVREQEISPLQRDLADFIQRITQHAPGASPIQHRDAGGGPSNTQESSP